MVDEMLVAQAQWLPQYAGAIEDAKRRLSRKSVDTRDWQGAARREVRPVEVVRPERGEKEAASGRRETGGAALTASPGPPFEGKPSETEIERHQ